MTRANQADPTQDPIETLADPDRLRDRPEVPFVADESVHEDRAHCSSGVEGRVVVGVTNDAGETLLLVNRDLSVALLPHGTVDAADDWAERAREVVEGQTGVPVALTEIEQVWDVDHFVEGEDDPHTSTQRVVFRGDALAEAIQDCKLTAEAGSDAWEADWFETVPGDLSAPEDPAADLALVFE